MTEFGLKSFIHSHPVVSLIAPLSREDLSGRLPATAADLIVNCAKSSYGLHLLGKIEVPAVGDNLRKIAFVDSSPLVQHNRVEWQLVEPDDQEA